jgi:hypothetical protein
LERAGLIFSGAAGYPKLYQSDGPDGLPDCGPRRQPHLYKTNTILFSQRTPILYAGDSHTNPTLGISLFLKIHPSNPFCYSLLFAILNNIKVGINQHNAYFVIAILPMPTNV